MIKNIAKRLIYLLIFYQLVYSGKSPHLSLIVTNKDKPGLSSSSSCKVCHIVHSAKSVYLSPPPKSITVVEFTTPRGNLSERDLLCMKCHTDNVTLQIEFPGFITNISKSNFLGKNMIDDHPVGIHVSESFTFIRNKKSLPLGKNKTILCVTCHDPHQNTFPPLLRLPKNELCLTCHENANLTFEYAHRDEDCGKCHQLHNTSNSSLIFVKKTLNECLNCHSNSHIGIFPKLNPKDIILDFNNPFIQQEQKNSGCLKCHKFHKKMDGFGSF
ncbi:hypothetical protein NLC26_03290 [Candidatus Aminicenantes bacterium AC-708-M15]|jgi:predicted CXXCH cytochrome family protein|nr:hypothetical protein [SCandidatus Aminicenantes bacterium Aminicenantia_JdfR_composite]MCP2598532.1 hypothetical protein [Candidatus Aminicenantes bacterium AC-335-L06]MCP2599215.1 hypothetical protein [Candidatus Aminicenantes bacterium AC-335-B20]MCP2604488.1 hypothetical protein [Candidatus Aminicenantes bacterium AC-708-M15]